MYDLSHQTQNVHFCNGIPSRTFLSLRLLLLLFFPMYTNAGRPAAKRKRGIVLGLAFHGETSMLPLLRLLMGTNKMFDLEVDSFRIGTHNGKLPFSQTKNRSRIISYYHFYVNCVTDEILCSETRNT